MRRQVFLLLSVSLSVCSDDLTLVHLDGFHPMAKEPEKYSDIYTNHDDYGEVVDSYYGSRRRPNNRRFERLPEMLHDISAFEAFPRIEKISPMQIEDSSRLDRIDFHYPNVEPTSDRSEELTSNFGNFADEQSSEKDRYVFMQSQKLVTSDGEEDERYKRNKRPAFKTLKYKKINSYVQRIPKATTPSTYENRYEELSMNNTNSTTMKVRINHLLRRYLGKLYEKKYNNNNNNNNTVRHIQSNALSGLEQEQKTKKLPYSNILGDLKNKAINKINKIFSLFTIVQFNNTQCTATNTAGVYQGVCYTASECSSKGGSAVGDCANGYGVCCVFIGTCGGSGSQNCTYFQSPNYPDYYPSDGSTVAPTTTTTTTTTTTPAPGTPDPRLPWDFSMGYWGRQTENDAYTCTFNVTKLNDNVSKIRIDFEDLELTGPTNGSCTDERLVISGQNTNNQIPVICGYNTGQHVYVDVSSLSGPLQLSVLSSSGSRKRFKIKICQFDDTCLEPTSNCLQYYTGVTGVISSFNYDQAAMLSRSTPGYFNNLNYAICIRREDGYCSISYRNVVNGMEYPFQLTNVDDSGNMIILPGQAGADIFNCPDDYIVIDGTRLCGDKFNDGSVNDDFTMNANVTDTGAGPIVIPVRTDSMVTGLGFKLFYTQNPCADY